MRYIIYCDESDEKGRYYSNFYGGALLKAADKERIETELNATKANNGLQGEAKWTKISSYNKDAYKALIDKTFQFIESGELKIRVMFTQNINRLVDSDDYQIGNEFFILYYQFIKHAFGLRYCNPQRTSTISINVLLDDAPDTEEKFNNFKDYLSSLSAYPIFHQNQIIIEKQDIADVDSRKHVILQCVDIILGAMQFRASSSYLESGKGDSHGV